MGISLAAASALLGAIGAVGQAFTNAVGQKNYQESLNDQRGRLLTDLYNDPTTNPAYQALLRQADEREKRNNDAIANRAVAGNATFENTLAAKQAGVDAKNNLYTGLLQSEDQRRRSTNNQILALDSRAAQQNLAAAQANGQAWNSWGSTLASGMLDYDTAFFNKNGKYATLGNLFGKQSV